MERGGEKKRKVVREMRVRETEKRAAETKSRGRAV